MPTREILNGTETHLPPDSFALACCWNLSGDMVGRLVQSADEFWEETRIDTYIISGYRTAQEQATLARRGRPAAADELSTHRSSPATGADVSWSRPLIRDQKYTWMRILGRNGLRGGGGSPLDESGSFPTDFNHVDLGPRR